MVSDSFLVVLFFAVLQGLLRPHTVFWSISFSSASDSLLARASTFPCEGRPPPVMSGPPFSTLPHLNTRVQTLRRVPPKAGLVTQHLLDFTVMDSPARFPPLVDHLFVRYESDPCRFSFFKEIFLSIFPVSCTPLLRNLPILLQRMDHPNVPGSTYSLRV